MVRGGKQFPVARVKSSVRATEAPCRAKQSNCPKRGCNGTVRALVKYVYDSGGIQVWQTVQEIPQRLHQQELPRRAPIGPHSPDQPRRGALVQGIAGFTSRHSGSARYPMTPVGVILPGYFFFFFAWARSLAAMLFCAFVALGFASSFPARLASFLLVVIECLREGSFRLLVGVRTGLPP